MMLKLISLQTRIVLLCIFLVAAFLRFFQLGVNPAALTWDEVALGYNAYSLGIDGKDEFGRFLPLDYLESFGDFKPPLYAYLSITPVKIFGMTEFATRFASAFFGVLTVVVTFFLVKRIFYSIETTQKNTRIDSNMLALFSTFFLAISPWHINLSRAAFEANVASFFIVAGIWLFLMSIQIKKWYLPFSIILFALSMYTFNTARVVSPLLISMLFVAFGRKLLEMKKQVIVALIVGFVVMLPIAKFLLSPQASLRFQEVNIFSDIGLIYRSNQQIENDNNAWWSKILHNRRFLYTTEYLRHYVDHLNPNFLFIRGDGNPKFSTQDIGQLYLWELPFFISGVFILFRKRIGSWWIVPLWLLLGIVPAATARETPHALRIEATLPTFQILTAIGVTSFIAYLKHFTIQKTSRNLVFSIVVVLLVLNIAYYLHGYYKHYSREYSGEWQYGYKESVAFVQEVENEFDKIYFTTELGRPYAYYIFYGKVDPKKFRQDVSIEREVFGFVHVKRIGKYYFAKDLKKDEQPKQKVLYINITANVPENAQKLKTFYLLNGKPVLTAYTL